MYMIFPFGSNAACTGVLSVFTSIFQVPVYEALVIAFDRLVVGLGDACTLGILEIVAPNPSTSTPDPNNFKNPLRVNLFDKTSSIPVPGLPNIFIS